jgi:hypothetical protein
MIFVRDFRDFKGFRVLGKHEILDSHLVRDFRDFKGFIVFEKH